MKIIVILIAVLTAGFIFTPEDYKNLYWVIGTLIFILLYIYSHLQRDSAQKYESDKVVDLNDFRRQKNKEQMVSNTKADKPKWVTLIVNSDQTEINLALSLLQSRGMECYVINRHIASFFPAIEGMEMHLQVRAYDYDEAVQICKKHDINIADDKSEMIH